MKSLPSRTISDSVRSFSVGVNGTPSSGIQYVPAGGIIVISFRNTSLNLKIYFSLCRWALHRKLHRSVTEIRK